MTNKVAVFLVIFLFSSCTLFKNNPSPPERFVASEERDLIFLSKGLYPNSLRGKNIFDSESKAKIVFNLPPYINPGEVGILPELLKTIDGAKLSIRMSVFQFNHKEVFEALKRAVKRGVRVYIATDLCYSSKVGYKEFFEDLSRELIENGQTPSLQIVDDKTASCETMFNHNKYMVVDYEDEKNVRAWFGSFNPTNHGAVENVELAVVLNDKRAATILKLDFDQQISGVFKVYKKGIYSTVEKGIETIVALSNKEIEALLLKGVKVSYPRVVVGDTEFEFILSPKVKSLTRIIEEVYRSQKEILFSSFAIADQMLISSIINKSEANQSNHNLFSVLTLPHPYDFDGHTFVKNGNPDQSEIIYQKKVNEKRPSVEAIRKLAPIVDEIKSTLSTPSNYLTPKNELKSTIHAIYPKGEAGGLIEKVHVEGIFNSKIIDEKNTYQRFVASNIPVYKSTLSGELHNKLFLIDEKVTIFGSHNFSQAAENGNDELTVIIKSAKLAQFLKNELYEKTKLFSIKEGQIDPRGSQNITLAITEVLSESHFRQVANKKEIDIGDYIEIYNYGDRPINLLGVRYDDHYFPDKDNERLDFSTNTGMQGTLVRFIPSVELNTLGSLDYSPHNNILLPGQSALIVGKYFHDKFYKNQFIEAFRKKFGKNPVSSDFPLLFSSGEFFSSVLGDSASGITYKDRISLFGIDGMTMLDFYSSTKKASKIGLSIERTINSKELKDKKETAQYELVRRKYFLKNGLELDFSAFLPNYEFSHSEDWREGTASGGTPGVVDDSADASLKNRTIASASTLYTIEADYADVSTNTFKKALLVIKDGKIIDIASPGLNQYPAPLIKDVLLFPGLVDAHNHIKYNTMPIWKVSKTYENRNQWPEESVYKNAIKELYKNVYMEWPQCTSTSENEKNNCEAINRCKIIRYAEIKALVGGTTSIQGSSSFDETSSDITFKGLTGYTAGSGKKIIKSKARGLEDLLDECSSGYARNIEREKWQGHDEVRTTAQSIFSDAFAHKSIDDEKKYKQTPSFKLNEEFKNKITNSFFVHLGEGVDQSSQSEWNELDFLKLSVPQVTIIHGTAFGKSEFMQMGEKNISLAWSPTSNLLLYKKTTDIPSALQSNVNVALGSDWSLSGTKSLLYELKVAANINAKYFNKAISDGMLLKMVTINGAKAAHVDNLIGSIEKSKLADFFILSKDLKGKTPLETLLKIKEENINAVFINGMPVVGKIQVLNDFKNQMLLQDDVVSIFSIGNYFSKTCSNQLGLVESSLVTSNSNLISDFSELDSKTQNAFKALNPKFQKILGDEFGHLDPICSDNDQRVNDIIQNL